MEILNLIPSLFTWSNLLFMNIGLFAGIAIGALPGLTATLGVALLLPVTYGFDSISGMLLLLGVYCGAIFGGSITAILIRTPGTPAAAATVIDGHTLAQKGHAGRALHAALNASVFGGLFSCLMLLTIAPILAAIALKFGSAEYFSLALFGLTIIATAERKNIFKGLLMGMFGLLITVIGIDTFTGVARFTFKLRNLTAGVDVVLVMVGLFAVSEVLIKVENSGKLGKREKIDSDLSEKLPIREIARHWWVLVKSSLIGSFIGAVPGTGSAIAAFLSYNEAKRSSKTPEQFGHGSIEGIFAPEAANNAVTGSAMIPVLTLGIPGDSVTAILLGALTMQGIVAGPRLFITDSHWVYSVILGLFVLNIFMYLQAKFFIRAFVNITRVPDSALIAVLIPLCVVGGLSAKNTMSDVYVVLIFGVLGYILRKLDFPMTPMIIGVVLGKLAEENLRRALILVDGDITTFITRPISAMFLVVTVLVLLQPVLTPYLARLLGRKQ